MILLRYDNMKKRLHELLLMEQPWVVIDDIGDESNGFAWDFCAEVGSEDVVWLQQLYDLFTIGKMTSLNPIKNSTKDITVSKEDMPKVIDELINDVFFINVLKHDLKRLAYDKRLALKSVMPIELLDLVDDI